MEPTLIDLESWPRREHFEHYLRTVPCDYAITTEIDVTAAVSALRRAYRKTYPAQIWALAAAVNRHEEFRMTLDPDGRPAVWPRVDPAFTVFNPERETFACVTAPFDEDFARFHDTVVELLETHRDSTTMFPQGPLPPHCFDVSGVPWTSFTGFTLQIRDGGDHLLPIFTMGRRVKRDDRILLPLAIQVHHAAADGFHTGRLLSEIRALAGNPSWLG
ncbi:CatA-like O-acetyltransferase [Aeromicrobium sp.]|uniref:CatA-like O-acetyltransferase n=1 Tax=Aeromicrobium sp. TaxID=1871063 RepID=UPI0028ADDFAC|nr:CatA-like O-acetyltransferase [Aeromicrobium sp.]